MHRDHIRRRLKLRQLEILLAVADAGSMAKAANRLAISQPAISRAIADVEHALGVPLFDRSPQGVEPTRYGRALLKRGVAAFDEIDQGVKDIEFLADPTVGELWIGSAPGLAEGILLAVIDKMSRKYPRVVFNIVPSHHGVARSGGAPDDWAQTAYDELRERRIELGFARAPEPAAEDDLETDVLFDDTLAVVAGVRNPWVRRRRIKLAELVNEPWTWPLRGTIIDSLVGNAFRASGIEPPRATVYADAINIRTRLAATGPYLAVVPASVMRFPGVPASIKVLPVELPTTQRPIGIITLKNRTLSPLAQLFIECAREVAKPLAKSQAPTGRTKTISARRSQTT